MPNHIDASSETQHSLKDLFDRAQTGDPLAVQDFFDQNAGQIHSVVRYKMNAAARLECDSSDILQQTRLKLCLCKVQTKRFESARALLAYILRIAVREIQMVLRHRQRRCRPVSLEIVSVEDIRTLVDRSAASLEGRIVEEQWQRALLRLNPVGKEIANLLRQGYTHCEIAEELMVCERTVRRVVRKLRELLGVDRSDSKPGKG